MSGFEAATADTKWETETENRNLNENLNQSHSIGITNGQFEVNGAIGGTWGMRHGAGD